jgi:hypothetical protein
VRGSELVQDVRVQLLEGSVPKYAGVLVVPVVVLPSVVVGVLVVPVSVVSVEVDVKHSSALFGDCDQHGGVPVAIPDPTSPAAKAASRRAILRAVTQAPARCVERLDGTTKRGKLANPFLPVKRDAKPCLEREIPAQTAPNLILHPA